MDKRFWGVIAAIAVIFIAIIVINNRNANAPDSGSDAKASSHIVGENKQNVTLVEYGDFQCPVCAMYFPTVSAVKEKYKQDISFQFRNFPLQSIHQNAFAASRAAEAANKQGKFWEMHDLLYQNQDPNGRQGWVVSRDPLNEFFTGFASQLQLNTDQFKTDYAGSEVNSIVNADVKAGNGLKVTGTPTFFLDGKRIELSELTGENGQPSEEKFSQLIDKAIRDKGGTPSVDPNTPATTGEPATTEQPADTPTDATQQTTGQ